MKEVIVPWKTSQAEYIAGWSMPVMNTHYQFKQFVGHDSFCHPRTQQSIHDHARISHGSLSWDPVCVQSPNYTILYGGFLKWWYPTTMGFPTKNDHFGVFWGYHNLRKHPYIYIIYDSSSCQVPIYLSWFRNHHHSRRSSPWGSILQAYPLPHGIHATQDLLYRCRLCGRTNHGDHCVEMPTAAGAMIYKQTSPSLTGNT